MAQTASDLRSGKTASVDAGDIVGTMPENTAMNKTITTQGGQITVPQGYHHEGGKVMANFANLTAANVKYPVNIGGVVGTYGKAAAATSPENTNMWLTAGAYSNELTDGETHVVGKFKINVTGNITIGVMLYNGTTGATGTTSVSFYKNGAYATSTSLYQDVPGSKTVYVNVNNVMPGDIIEMTASYSGTSSSAHVDQYYVHYLIEGIAPPQKL